MSKDTFHCIIHDIDVPIREVCPNCKKDEYDSRFLWRLTDKEIADECSRYSYVYPANDPLMNKLAVLFEASSRILKNQILIKKALKKK